MRAFVEVTRWISGEASSIIDHGNASEAHVDIVQPPCCDLLSYTPSDLFFGISSVLILFCTLSRSVYNFSQHISDWRRVHSDACYQSRIWVACHFEIRSAGFAFIFCTFPPLSLCTPVFMLIDFSSDLMRAAVLWKRMLSDLICCLYCQVTLGDGRISGDDIAHHLE